MTAFPPTFTHNVIARAELKHQRYVITNGRAGRLWILLALVLLVPALVASIAFTVLALVGAFIPAAHALGQTPLGGYAALHLIGMNIALYPVVTLITLGLAANSITREKRGRTWDHLRLTGQSGHAIVRGKWWATLRALLGDHLMVGVLRFGVVALAIAWFNPLLTVRWPTFPQAEVVLGLPPELVHIPLLSLVALVYTLLDAGLTGALGLIASLADTGGPVVVTAVLALRAVATAGGLALLVVTVGVAFGGGLLYLPLSLVGWSVYGLLIWALLHVAQTMVG